MNDPDRFKKAVVTGSFIALAAGVGQGSIQLQTSLCGMQIFRRSARPGLSASPFIFLFPDFYLRFSPGMLD